MTTGMGRRRTSTIQPYPPTPVHVECSVKRSISCVVFICEPKTAMPAVTSAARGSGSSPAPSVLEGHNRQLEERFGEGLFGLSGLVLASA